MLGFSLGAPGHRVAPLRTPDPAATWVSGVPFWPEGFDPQATITSAPPDRLRPRGCPIVNTGPAVATWRPLAYGVDEHGDLVGIKVPTTIRCIIDDREQGTPYGTITLLPIGRLELHRDPDGRDLHVDRLVLEGGARIEWWRSYEGKRGWRWPGNAHMLTIGDAKHPWFLTLDPADPQHGPLFEYLTARPLERA